MSGRTAQYDVFVSYAPADAGAARTVLTRFKAAGLRVFELPEGQAPRAAQRSLMQALAESSALVVIMRAGSVSDPGLAVEIGAARAWCKPVYVLIDDERTRAALTFLPEARLHLLARLDEVIEALQRDLQPLPAADRDALLQSYHALGTPTERLLENPAAVDALARQFHRRRGKPLPGERLVQELIRLRKQGQLSAPRGSS